MSREYEPTAYARGTARRSGLRTIVISVLIAFVAGAAMMGWAASRFGWFAAPAGEATLPWNLGSVVGLQEQPVPAATTSGPAAPSGPLDARVAELEARLSRISAESAAVSGNTSRAENLLVAFAARRALDRGAPLGYLEAMLQLRFGQKQPNAVATIIDVGRDPVTLDQIQQSLDDFEPALARAAPGGNFFADVQREISTLFVVRRDGSPSPVPSRRLERAHRFLDNGRVSEAIEEIERMPGAARARPWLDAARRYANARAALDIIETAAMVEPLSQDAAAPAASAN